MKVERNTEEYRKRFNAALSRVAAALVADAIGHKDVLEAWTVLCEDSAAQRDEIARLDERFINHTKEVERFLSEMYSIMVDPLAEGEIKVDETCKTLLEAARAQREQLDRFVPGEEYRLNDKDLHRIINASSTGSGNDIAWAVKDLLCAHYEIHGLKDGIKLLRETLTKMMTFIRYARYELDPGKAAIGDQFPKKIDADEHIALAESALEQTITKP